MAMFWVVPPPSNSQHQDCYIFSRGSQPKPSFATGILGGGTTQAMLVYRRVARYMTHGQVSLLALRGQEPDLGSCACGVLVCWFLA